MRVLFKLLFFIWAGLFTGSRAVAQLKIVTESNAQALVQKLLGEGIVVSNIKLTAGTGSTGFFNNQSGTQINLDSGIVLTNGRAKTGETAPPWGLNSNGTPSQNALANANLGMAGDADLARSIGIPTSDTHDATILEFDFIPLGDTIKFNYVFSSEEYTPAYVCDFNDAFGFFISGPGIPGLKNIALLPNTTIPVSIFNVNDVPGGACPNNKPYYVDNLNNKSFTHDGHTVVLTAIQKVIPCQTYHLKLVIADVGDFAFDSGVFLEAKSLSSNSIILSNTTQVDQQNNSYLVEGCATGSFKIKRPKPENNSLSVDLSYAGTAINGVDVQLLPSRITIPANQVEVIVNIIPIIDNIPEGIETLKIYALAGGSCGSSPTDSVIIQIRDYDTLGIAPDTVIICKNSSVQLTATAGYTSYQWDANPTLSNTAIRNPVATPNAVFTTYYCTSTEGTCHGRDSALVIWKALELITATGVNCKNGHTGEIKVAGGAAWDRPAQYAINNAPYQSDSTFSNLPVGTYTVKIKDAAGCIDSIVITIAQLFPDLLISNTAITAATCSGDANGVATVTVSGGNNPYLFSTDGINFQAGNVLNLLQGNYTVTVKDNNNCLTTKNIFIPLDNVVTVDAGIDSTICEGKSVQLDALSNADTYSWTPSLALSNNLVRNPLASPVQTTKYIVTATKGICTQKDSLIITVNPAPKANAGADYTICFGQDIQLTGSGGTSYYWYPSSYLNDMRIQSPTAKRLPGSISYSLYVTDDKGCVSLKKDTVLITVTRPALVNAGRDTTVAVGQPLQLFASDVNNIGFNQYEWITDYGLNDAHIAAPVAILDRNITYTVIARTSIGCEGTDNIKITVYKGPDIYVPNAFSPNGDNLNDILKAIPAGIKAFHYFRIYSRWGNLVFNTNDPLQGWDGKLKSVMQTPGTTFVWMAEGIDYKGNLVQRKGTVMIVK